MSDPIGRHSWAIPGGRIPFPSTGPEPAMTSRDELRLLNTGEADADVAITIINADADAGGPYRLCVRARRLRSVRINDLIDPLPVPLETDYAILVTSSEPIVVQFTRADSSRPAHAIAGTMAFAHR